MTWLPIKDIPAGFSGDILVACREERRGHDTGWERHIAEVREGKIVIVGGYFYFDRPKVRAWQSIDTHPTPEEGFYP